MAGSNNEFFYCETVPGMSQKFQFSITMILGATSIVALIMTRRSFWATVAVSEIVVVVLCAECLVRNLPTSIRRIMDANCFDGNGVRSMRRELVERKSLRELWWGIVRIFILILIPTNFLIWIFLAGGWGMVAEWQATSVADTEAVVEIGSTSEQLRTFGTVCLVAAVLWLIGALMVFNSAYLALLKDHNERVTRRAKRRKMRDWETNLKEGGESIAV
jgi:hypothetical protein